MASPSSAALRLLFLDLKALLDGSSASSSYSRLVSLMVGDRRVALGVDTVVGVRSLKSANLGELPPLLGGASTDRIEALGALDAQLLVLLRATHLVPNEVWESLAAAEEEPG